MVELKTFEQQRPVWSVAPNSVSMVFHRHSCGEGSHVAVKVKGDRDVVVMGAPHEVLSQLGITAYRLEIRSPEIIVDSIYPNIDHIDRVEFSNGLGHLIMKDGEGHYVVEPSVALMDLYMALTK